MAEIGYSLTANLLEVLAHEAINRTCELWGYKSQLEDLKKTVNSVKMVLLDADSKWDQLSNQDRNFIDELKDVVYDADDVFDEFRTLAELNQLGKLKKGGKYFDKVRCFFSSDKNQVGLAYRMSCDVKDIKKRLDAIASNHKKFELKVDNKPLCRRREETCSYVDVNDIIGREEDKEKIINMLLDPNARERVTFFAIVGVGGLGKTALAQLLFNDEKIKREFSERVWVCVSDQDGEDFDVKAILCKITGEKFDGTSTFESVQGRFQEKVKGKKYFLVLDDVWNEDREKWLRLEKFLNLGQGGSRVIITTRSKMTSTIMRDQDDHVHMLQGLAKEDSWRLFVMSAFRRHGEENHDELIEIGKKIVEKCYCIPLAIKVVGSLLFGQEISKWRSIEGSGLANIGGGDSGILPILKLSYHNLKPSLKNCFIYCAVFPKGFRITKKKLIGLWMAQGYVIPLDGGPNLEDVVEEHFLILLRRCFFQDIERDEYDVVESVKIHDLMHDVAQEVGKEEICNVTSITDRSGDKIRHVYVEDDRLEISIYNKKIRSYFGRYVSFVDAQINNWMLLRVLDLSDCCFVRSVPNSIRKLIHLRYLDLSENGDLKVLPESIAELYNLQTLDLSGCGSLEELPKGTSKLVNLRHLNLKGCMCLTCMPSGMDKLTELTILPLFTVGYKSIITNKKESGDGMLKDLKALRKIQGKICIKIGDNYKNEEETNENERSSYLKSMEDLRELTTEFLFEGNWAQHEAMLDNLKPPPNLKKLFLYSYKGIRMTFSLPLLVHIKICNCTNLVQMPVLSELHHLKSLSLYHLDSLEYIENTMNCSSNDTKESSLEFFPSLEFLVFWDLPKLKGCWKQKSLRMRFPRLSNMKIMYCPNLISFALYEFPQLQSLKIKRCPNMALNLVCPNLERFTLWECSERLQMMMIGNLQDGVKLREARIDKVSHLKSLSTSCLTHLSIRSDYKVESFLDVKEFFNSCASFLRVIDIDDCENLKRLSGLEYLTFLKKLILSSCENLSISEDDEEPWKSLSQSLRELDFCHLPRMKSMPNGMQHLTSLQTLKLQRCKNMEGGLPEWMSSLSSLQSLDIQSSLGIKSLPEAIKKLTLLKKLHIYSCPYLEERCKNNPKGLDFPKIQHIPRITFR